GKSGLRTGLGRAREFIAGELFGDKLVKWLVGIEGTDDVVTILVSVTPRRVGVAVAVRVGVTRDVQPVAAPAFAVMRGLEEPVDELFVGIGCRVREECRNLGGRRRQAREIEAGAAQQRDLFSVRRETEFLLNERADQERIDGRSDAVFGFGLWDGGLVNRLERPEGALFLGDGTALAQLGWFGAGGLRAGGDPLFDQRHLFAGELLVALRHFTTMNQLEKQTLAGLAWDNHRAVVAPLKHQTPQAQVEAAFQLLAFTVTFEAMRLEDRAYVLLERRRSSAANRKGSQQQPADSGGNLVRAHFQNLYLLLV